MQHIFGVFLHNIEIEIKIKKKKKILIDINTKICYVHWSNGVRMKSRILPENV